MKIKMSIVKKAWKKSIPKVSSVSDPLSKELFSDMKNNKDFFEDTYGDFFDNDDETDTEELLFTLFKDNHDLLDSLHEAERKIEKEQIKPRISNATNLLAKELYYNMKNHYNMIRTKK